MNLAELLEIPASMFPEREVVRFEGQTITYGELEHRVAQTAGALQALGVGPGDRVAAIQTNTPPVVEALYGAARLGAVLVPLNFRARDEEIRQMLAIARPSVLLAGDRYLDLARGLATGTERNLRIVSLESAAEDAPSLAALAAEASPGPYHDVADDDGAVLLFTSGTTAAPKAVILSHGSLTGFVLGTTEPGDGSNRGTTLVAAPLYHIAGVAAVLGATFAGRRIALMRQFDAAEWLSLVAAERVTHAFLVPTMLRRVLDHPDFPRTDLSSLQVFSYGAAPAPTSLVRRAIAAFPDSVQLINAFGQTETASTVTMLGPEDHRLEGAPEAVERKLRRLASVGRPLPDVELRIVDEQEQPLPAGQIGEVAIRADRLMRGYYRQPAATEGALHDGWLYTRDLGWMDEDGYLFLTGRKSDLIIRGGENIAPEEVEAVLESHPAVAEAGVIGLPEDEWGERVAAVVVLTPGALIDPKDLIDYCHGRLASFKKPEAVYFTDALPRNALGKLLRSDLRRHHAGESATAGAPGE